MGLFSSKTKVYVASQAWNLAGDQDQRTDLIPSLVLSHIMSGSTASLAEAMQNNLRSTSSLRNRAFYRWAREHYALGLPTGSIGADVAVKGPGIAPALKQALGLGSNHRIRILSAAVDDADLEYWAELWVRKNRPEISEDDYTADFVNGQIEIVIGEQVNRIPAPADFLWGIQHDGRKLLFLAYMVLTRNAQGFWDASETRMFTYRMGTGIAAFDALEPATQKLGEFYPTIPIRIDNRSIKDDEDRWDGAAEAFKKLTGGDFEELVDQIDEHESVGDMDHAFVLSAVSLNTKENSGKAYLYAFFRELMRNQRTREGAVDFMANRQAGKVAEADWIRWTAANLAGTGSYTNPTWDKATPDEGQISRIQGDRNQLQIRMPEMPEMNFCIRWGEITETNRVGNAKRYDGNQDRPLAKKGEYWITKLSSKVPNGLGFMGDALASLGLFDSIGIFHQYEERRYRLLTITQLSHANYVYRSKTVGITSHQALDDEDESGFLIPLHYPTLTKMNLVHNANLAACTSYVVINSYQKVKTKWYQRGFFKVLVFVAAIVISVVTAGAGLPAAAGVLGTNAAVGAAMGFAAGTMVAAIAGAVANGIAALLLTTVLTKASTKLFGEKWGTVIATVITMFSMQAANSFAQTGSINVDWGQMMRIDNLMGLTNAMSGAYSQMMMADTLDIQNQMAAATESYEAQSKEITQLTEDILGMTNVSTDVMLLTDASEHFGERSDVFLSRTLLTGSDLAGISHAMIRDFAELTLELPGAL